jgi:hypothetical protein
VQQCLPYISRESLFGGRSQTTSDSGSVWEMN